MRQTGRFRARRPAGVAAAAHLSGVSRAGTPRRKLVVVAEIASPPCGVRRYQGRCSRRSPHANGVFHSLFLFLSLSLYYPGVAFPALGFFLYTIFSQLLFVGRLVLGGHAAYFLVCPALSSSSLQLPSGAFFGVVHQIRDGSGSSAISDAISFPSVLPRFYFCVVSVLF